MAAWADGYWWSKDGLRLHYRDYPGPAERPAILCLPGLTRNARDFAAVADRLAGQWRLICVDLRGRGESAYAKDPMSYSPLVYVQDLEALIDELAPGPLIAFGTSLGGILTMLLSATARQPLAGALINDIGPAIESAGLARIRAYVGRGGSWPTWLHAARGLAEGHGTIYPDYSIADWIGMSKRLCRITSAGRIVPDYDMRIGDPLRVPGGEAGFDMWPTLASLREVPALLVRGGLSDLLSADTAAEMARRLPKLEQLTLPDIGHAPTLDEPECRDAIDRLLARVLAGR
ncbi:MAG: alpha/beta hydrolase fold protein [Sphingomonas bacterium]|jgi:pimeloyl-ACP methyl ester carboxylesterase|nr:alpha/beta fold hydrolase [Sphingomonas bacterium]MDB5690728.1 alpha/beta hydrolase fold protein [Sphingomonas bacterium]